MTEMFWKEKAVYCGVILGVQFRVAEELHENMTGREGIMRRYIMKIAVILLSLLFLCKVIISFVMSLALDFVSSPNEKNRVQRDRVESFFAGKGYEIDIIGAYTNGREHEGPFLYGWYWDSFEIGADGSEVIMLYYYDEKEEMNGYLAELDEKERNRCYLSKHIIFYYDGNDTDIMNVIKEYCKLEDK